MWTAYLAVAEAGVTWTPETYYIAAAVAHLVLILLTFRLLHVPTDHANFISALFIVVPVNGLAYFTKDLALVGVLMTGALLFILLAAVIRGDVLKALVAWIVVVSSYWVMAYFILPAADDLVVEDLGSLTQVLVEGGLEAEPFTDDEYEQLSGGEEEEER